MLDFSFPFSELFFTLLGLLDLAGLCCLDGVLTASGFFGRPFAFAFAGVFSLDSS